MQLTAHHNKVIIDACTKYLEYLYESNQFYKWSALNCILEQWINANNYVNLNDLFEDLNQSLLQNFSLTVIETVLEALKIYSTKAAIDDQGCKSFLNAIENEIYTNLVS